MSRPPYNRWHRARCLLGSDDNTSTSGVIRAAVPLVGRSPGAFPTPARFDIVGLHSAGRRHGEG